MGKKKPKRSPSTDKKKPKMSSDVKLSVRDAMHTVTSGVSVHVISRKDGWAVKRSGTSRASKVYDNKGRAISRAKELAKKASGTLVVHRKDGTIQKRESTAKKSKN